MKVKLKTGATIISNICKLYVKNNIEMVNFKDVTSNTLYNIPKSAVLSIELI